MYLMNNCKLKSSKNQLIFQICKLCLNEIVIVVKRLNKYGKNDWYVKTTLIFLLILDD